MDPEIKAKWVAALRSGKYKQGRGRLRSGDEFCCLGVLCDIVYPQGWTLSVFTDTTGSTDLYYLTPNVLRQVGMQEKFMMLLGQMNDGQTFGTPSTFNEIADVIEKEA